MLTVLYAWNAVVEPRLLVSPMQLTLALGDVRWAVKRGVRRVLHDKDIDLLGRRRRPHQPEEHDEKRLKPAQVGRSNTTSRREAVCSSRPAVVRRP